MAEAAKPNLTDPVHLLAFGFGSGCVPKAPGTAGTIAAIIPWLWLGQLTIQNYLLLLAIAIVLGIYICDKTSRDLGVHDHSGIVWDEFCGLWLTMAAVPQTWYWLVIGFVLFRIFDIFKPWPISWLDKKVAGGLGIMIDDLLAAVYAWLILQLILYFYLPTSLYSTLLGLV